jgi:hypothetical protein
MTKKQWEAIIKSREEKLLADFAVITKEKDAKIAELTEALEAVDDHGRATSFMEMLRSAKSEIDGLKKALKRINSDTSQVILTDEERKLIE